MPKSDSDAILEASLRTLLSGIPYPGFSRDIVSFGIVRDVRVGDESGTKSVLIQLVLSTDDPSVARELHDRVERTLAPACGGIPLRVLVDVQAPVRTQSQGTVPIDGVRNVIAVASGKGGVGKSTLSVNLAAALRSEGLSVGLCDCDLYGPSVALMCGASDRPMADESDRILPVERHGLRLISMGLLLDDDSPAVLRGPMVSRYTQQFLRNVVWNAGGDLDVLVLDLPPGTGDIQLTVVQTIPLAGAVIVTTPQEVALIDARKAVSMFAKTNVPILGIIENMSGFTTPDGVRHEIFGNGGGEREASRLGVPFLGALPLDPAFRIASDEGVPLVLASPESPSAALVRSIASALAGRLAPMA